MSKRTNPWEFQSPKSSNVAGARYSPETKTLEVDFHRSGTYLYYNFPKTRWDGFRKATSKGTYLSTEIKPKFGGVRRKDVLEK